MTRRLIKACLLLFLITIAAPLLTTQSDHQLLARQTTELGFEGEFTGQLDLNGEESDRVEAELRVTSLSDNSYRATLYIGGGDDNAIQLEGVYEDYTLRLTGDSPYKLQFIHGRYTALDDENNYKGHFNRQVAVSPDN